jgi:serine phosphatase RsbU (regulator of sigma subunit)
MNLKLGLALICVYAAHSAAAYAAPASAAQTDKSQPPQSQKPATPPGSVNNPHNPHSTPPATTPTNTGTTAPSSGSTTRRRTTTRSRKAASTGSGTRTVRPSPAVNGSAGSGGTTASAPSAGSKRPHAKKRHHEPAPAVPLRRPQPPVAQHRSVITRTVHRIDRALPGWLEPLLAVAAVALLALLGNAVLAARRARKLRRQRSELLEEIGILQATLLPEVPDEIAGLALSVAYSPAEGPAAGGDFYDAFPLTDGRAAVIVGDISGHGKLALEHTSLLRYTLRAYLGAGFEPRQALALAQRVLDDDLRGDFATVIVAVFDPGEGAFTYASAGHPPPIVLSTGTFEPITACASPPIGAQLPTGRRQTSLRLPGPATVCFYTDGLVEGRKDGVMLGNERLTELLTTPPTGLSAEELLRRVVDEIDQVSDDMAVCIVGVPAPAGADPFRLEELEVEAGELDHPSARHFIDACELEPPREADVVASLKTVAGEFGTAVLRVRSGTGETDVKVLAPQASVIDRAPFPEGASFAVEA